MLDNVDRLEFLYAEIQHAKEQLAPQDTGHISTAIGWMQHRTSEIKKELKNGHVTSTN